ncbi:MAG: hypothetical protein ABR582_15025 [Gemmatimonadaceae bacterium]
MKSLFAFCILLSVTGLPRVGRAQGDDIFSWGVAAGAAIPAKGLATDHHTGVNAGITMAIGGIGQLLGFRIDGMWNEFGAKSGTTAESVKIVGGSLNLVTSLIGNSDRLYLIGGVGGYGIRGIVGQASKNDFGINGGIGYWLPFANSFIEARYHHFYRALPNKQPAVFIPITLGILF